MAGCNGIVSDQYAPLTSATDAFGNEVRYDYESVIPGECRLREVSWGYNEHAGFEEPFARVVFTYDRPPSCTSPVIEPGSRRDLGTGDLIVTGASKLMTITATAFPVGAPGQPVHTRAITLGYSSTSELCDRPHAPVRLLESIQESAWGTDAPRVDLPAISFDYGPAVQLGAVGGPAATPWHSADFFQRDHNLAWGYRRVDDRWPTVEAMLLDIDGDGLLDRVTNIASNPDATITSCGARWFRNTGPDGSGNPTFSAAGEEITLPRLKWRGANSPASQDPGGGAAAFRASPSFEGCALNGQVTAYQNSTEALLQCHDQANAACQPGTDPLDSNTYCAPGGTECPNGAGGPASADYRTYLAYRWLDMDADGLVDLVAAVHGDIDAYDIERGNLHAQGYGLEPSISGIPGVGGPAWPACTPGERCKKLGRCMDGTRTCAGGLCVTNWTDVNQCLEDEETAGCFDIIAAPGGSGNPSAPVSRAPYMRCEGLYPWFIYKNQGNGAFASVPIVKYQPLPLESDAGDSAVSGPGVVAKHHAIIDFDGDGVLDALAHGKAVLEGNPDAWYVWLGDGSGGFGPKRYTFPTRYQGSDGHANVLSGQGTAASSPITQLGRPDRHERGRAARPLAEPGRLAGHGEHRVP